MGAENVTVFNEGRQQMTMLKRRLAVCALSAAMATGTQAQAEYKWQFEGRIDIWMPSVQGTTITGQDVNISFGELIDTLRFGFMGGLEARNGRWSLLGDFQYMELTEGIDASFGPFIPVTVDADVDALIFTGVLGYDVVQTDSYRLTPFAGFRFMDMTATVNLEIAGGSDRVTGDDSNFDGIVGIRGTSQMNDRWELSYYADIGTGDSDLTWQLAATVDYRLNQRWTISAGYRHMAWEYDDPVVLRDVAVSGPIIGARIKF